MTTDDAPHPFWAHAWAAGRSLIHLASVGLIVSAAVALLWLASSFADRNRRQQALAQAAQPVVLAQPVARQPSAAEIAAELQKVGITGAVRLAPKPGTKKARPHGESAAAAGADGHGAGGREEAASADAGAPSLVQAAAEQPVATVYPRQKIKAGECRWGCTTDPTLTGKPSEEPAFKEVVTPDPRPRFQFGGLRRAGVAWDPIGHTFGAFVEHDFFQLHLGSNDSCAAKSWRCGRALVLGARPFASFGYQALPGAKSANYGVPITVALEY